MADSLLELASLVDSELSRVSDPERRKALAALLNAPIPLRLNWNYGTGGERLNCWQVGRSPDGEVILAYCKKGFGPTFPWGFVFPEEDSLGMCQFLDLPHIPSLTW